jgi:uncharacterized membrane protein YcaP (DUF421 family)
MDLFELARFVMKPVAIYLTALALVRLMGKRALGELSLFDLVIMAGIGDIIVVVGLGQISFLKGLIILGLLTGLELFFSMVSFRSRFWAGLLEGHPTLLIKDGNPLEENLAREHISQTDLRQELRKQGVARISQVSQAVLEACGKFSIILKEEEEPALNRYLLQEIKLLQQEIKELKEIVLSRKED